MKKVKKVFEKLLTVIMVLVIAFAFLMVGVRLFGLTPYTVLSGSMEPTYHVGSLIYVKDVDPADLDVDDPITYLIDNKTVVTHRIIEVLYDDDGITKIGFKTKGDNNEDPDGTPVSPENILGKPVFSIPLLGYIIFYVQRPPWNAVAIGLLVLILGFAFLPDLLDKFGGDPPPGDGEGKDKDDTPQSEGASEESPQKAEEAIADTSPPAEAENSAPPENE